VSTSTEQLEIILSETVEHAREREREAFDQVAGSVAQSIVLYGAGNLGRRVLYGLRENGIDPLAFCDSNAALTGKKIEGVPVLSLHDAIARFGRSAVFVVCIWHPDAISGVRQILDTLSEIGAISVLPFSLLFWKFSNTFMPYYYWDLPSNYLYRSDHFRTAFGMLADEESRRQFVVDLDLRINAIFCKGPIVDHGRQYFPKDLFQIAPNECFVDCGAYDGDTIKDLAIESVGAFHKVIAFEADPDNFARLQQSIARNRQIVDRVVLHQAAVASTTGTLRFAASAAANAAVSSAGEMMVNSVALDDVLALDKPTMIKMDIEGSELSALRGAASTIKTHKPLLAICAYHQPLDLFEIPFALNALEPESLLFLRSYAMDGFDTVCYSVPPNRSVAH